MIPLKSSKLTLLRPLNVIGMPYYTEPLLSNIPTADYAPISSPFFNPPEPIAPSVLNSIKIVDFVGYATTPRELRGKRYVVSARAGAGKRATSGKGSLGGRRESAPRFRSEKDRKGRTSVPHEVDEEVSLLIAL
jgi:PAB-dependent poly(A)-specific ribonuclease subunit 2